MISTYDDLINPLTLDNLVTTYNSNEIEDIIDEIMISDSKKRYFLLFKLFYNSNDLDVIKLMKIQQKKHPYIFHDLGKIMSLAFICRNQKIEAINNRIMVADMMNNYNTLLSKMQHLAHELDMNNALELSILYSYLLWNGYLSKTKQNQFEWQTRKFINGLHFADITNGIGVCLDHSEMLTDFLNHCGYSSTMIMNCYGDRVKAMKTIDIKRKFPKTASEDTITSRILEIINMNKINHIFNLIEEDNKLYLYDSTNLSLYKIDNSYLATIINGTGKVKLFPYQSYGNCITESNIALLDRLLCDKITTSPYTKGDFASISEINIDIIKNSISLLEDFYVEARPDILKISQELDKIPVKKKTIK